MDKLCFQTHTRTREPLKTHRHRAYRATRHSEPTDVVALVFTTPPPSFYEPALLLWMRENCDVSRVPRVTHSSCDVTVAGWNKQTNKQKKGLEGHSSVATQMSVSSGNEERETKLGFTWRPEVRVVAFVERSSVWSLAQPILWQAAFSNRISQKFLDLSISWVLKTAVGFAWLIFNNQDVFNAPRGYDETAEVFLEFLLLAKIRFTAAQEMFACWHLWELWPQRG